MEDAADHGVAAVIMVLSTPEAEAILKKGGLTVVDLFRPFGDVEDLNATVQTVGEPYQLRKFSMRFADVSEMREIPQESSDKHMMRLMAQYDHEQIWMPTIDYRPVDPTAPTRAPMPDWALDAMDGENASAQASWFAAVRKQLVASAAYAEHSTVDHPVACLHVAASSQPGPVGVFNALFGAASLPASLRDGMADYNLVKCYVLLHDLSTGPADVQASADGLQEISRAYGTDACKLLPINSRVANAPPLPDLWTAARPPAFDATAAAPPPPAAPDQELGALLSDADMEQVRKLVAGPLAKLVLGHLQQRVVQISATVKASRQGVKNMMRSWLGGKKGPETASPAPSASSAAAASGGAPRYTANTIEAQLRQLADYAFLLRDYATALANYRLAGADFKGDKAWRHYAGTLEMAALCLYLADGSRRDLEDSLEKAASHYLRGGSPRHATKATLLQLDLLKQPPTKGSKADALRAGLRDAATVLVAQSTHESHLMAAVLLEQAALCFRSMRPALPRKFAFHLILAGFRFIQCGQRRHAVRAYAAALAVYSRKGWTHVEDHVHFTLGRNCATLGKVELALQFFLRLLGHSRQPADRQQTFMKEFSNILHLNPQHASLPALPVPRFGDRTIKVLLGDNARGPQSAGPEALTDNSALWKALVTPLKGREANTGGNWLQKSAAVAAEPTYVPCVQGEWIYVEVEIDNPMHVSLQLSSLKLACTHTPAAAAAGNADDAGAPPEGGGAANLELDEHALTLAAGKRSMVRLGVRPLAEGTLVIAGASWTLGEMVHGRHEFTLHGRRLNDTRQHRMAKHYAFEQSLRLDVVGPMPLLQAALEAIPTSLLLGQVVLAKLVLTNGGRTPLTALRLRLSHPSFCAVAEEATPPTAADAGQQAAAAVSGLGLGLGLGLAAVAVAAPPLFRERTAQAPPADWATVALPLPGGELQPGHSCTLPLWLRAAAEGAHALHFVFCYEAVTPHRLLKRRLCSISAQLSVEPSLTLRHFLRPAHACAQGESYVLGITALNAARRPGLRLLPAQVSCVSSAWQMTPLTAAGQRPEPLSPGEEFSLYFSLTRAPPPAASTSASASAATAAAAAAAATTTTATAAAPAAPTRVVHSELTLAGKAAVDSRASPHTSLLLRDGAPSTSAASVASAASRGPEERTAPARRRKKGEVVLEPELAAVVLHYRAEEGSEGGGAQGQLHLTGLLPQPLAPPAPIQQAPKRPKPTVVALWTDAARNEVRLWAECRQEVSHDFGASPLCEIEVKLHVRNTSRTTHLAFDLEAAGSGATPKPELPAGGGGGGGAAGGASAFASVPSLCTPGGQYMWLGLTSLKQEWLKPGEKTVLTLRAAVLSGGVYLLDSYRVLLCAWRANAEQAEQPFSPPVACPLPVGTAVSVVDTTP